MRLLEMIYTEEEYKELADELEYVRIIKDSAEKTLKEVREENRKLKSELSKFRDSFKRYRDFSKQELADSLYDSEEQNKKLKEEIDNGFNRETDLRNKRADSLLENKDLRDKIEELEKEIEELNKMMLFETELEK